MSSLTTIHELLQVGSNDAIAVAGQDRSALTYAGLRKLVSETVAVLNELGIGRNDRVAIVLNNGPEMATAFVSIACCATAIASLLPAYRYSVMNLMIFAPFAWGCLASTSCIISIAPWSCLTKY